MSARDAERMARMVKSEVEKSGGRSICFTEKLKADETSLPFKVFDVEGDAMVRPDAAAKMLKTVVPQDVVATTIVSQVSKRNKVLQTLRYYSLLFGLPDGKYLFIHFEVVVPLQLMCNGKADTYYQCFMASASVGLEVLSREFRRRQRLPVSVGTTWCVQVHTDHEFPREV
jgi:hypothetical protein